MNKFENCIAVVTGAGSGIGRHLALQLAQRGAHLAISDIEEQGLNDTAQQLEQYGKPVHSAVLDVSNRQAVFDYADTVTKALGPANLVINNAGVALASGDLQTTSLEEFEWLMGINFSGVLYGTKAFLPILEQAKWGHIVNISSLFGIISVAEQAAYNASKFAVRGMTEALRQELDQSNSHISCTSVHPGGIKTNIARNARTGANLDEEAIQEVSLNSDRFDRVARTTPESAAIQIIRAVEKNKRRLLIGKDAKLMDWVQRHFPNHYQRVFQTLADRMMRER